MEDLEVEGVHEIVCCGAKVRIGRDGIEVLSGAKVTSCPLHGKGRAINEEEIRQGLHARIQRFGFFQGNRSFDPVVVVPFGTSEIIKAGLQQELLQCSVSVCDGAGTVITDNPALMQGIGARMSGVVKTSPVPGIIESIRTGYGIVLDKETAKIDQLGGVKKAAALGCKKIAVTVAGYQAESIEAIRDFENLNQIEVSIFSVCNTSVDENDIRFLSMADAVWACASKIVRERIGPRALMQIGIGIPVFVLTQRGRELALAYLENFDGNLVVFRQNKMPYLVKEHQPSLREED